jgi:hypothetical protein
MEDKLIYTKIKHIDIEALVGANIYNCIAEAILLSTTNIVPVMLIHNGTLYHIDGYKIINSIYQKQSKAEKK